MFGNRGLTKMNLGAVLGVTALFVAITLILNPLGRLKESRDTKRLTDIRNLLNAAKNQQVDNGGKYLDSIAKTAPGVLYMIGGSATNCTQSCIGLQTNPACVDLSALQSAGYIQNIPFDPQHGDPELTGYYLIRKATGELEIGACQSSGQHKLSVTR